MTRTRDFIGPYQLARLIRVGNTVQIWEAIHNETEERFALKLLRPDYVKNRQEIAFLKQEFEVAHNLKHPNIIRVHEFVREFHAPFLVLELYDARNLKQVLRERKELMAYLAQKAILQAAEALTYFNSEGWIHCDVKPDNFLVNGEGFIKLIDFAIAKPIKQSMFSFNFSKKVQGTRSYMSPEQIRGKRLDARADVYSFGCVIFEFLAGRAPYTGENPNDLLKNHLSAPIPSITVYNSNVTNEMNDLVRSMIAKRPEDRPESMWDFLKVYRSIRVHHQPPPRPEGAPALDR